MSMINAQCDELRAMAGSVGLAVPKAATLMMGAADTIDHLDAENAKLRELASGLHRCIKFEDCEGCPMQDDDSWCVRDIRLRELRVEVDG